MIRTSVGSSISSNLNGSPDCCGGSWSMTIVFGDACDGLARPCGPGAVGGGASRSPGAVLGVGVAGCDGVCVGAGVGVGAGCSEGPGCDGGGVTGFSVGGAGAGLLGVSSSLVVVTFRITYA